jgi:hypothetical protein
LVFGVLLIFLRCGTAPTFFKSIPAVALLLYTQLLISLPPPTFQLLCVGYTTVYICRSCYVIIYFRWRIFSEGAPYYEWLAKFCSHSLSSPICHLTAFCLSFRLVALGFTWGVLEGLKNHNREKLWVIARVCYTRITESSSINSALCVGQAKPIT